MHRLPIAPPCPTASKLALAFACPASVQLSQNAPDTMSAAASWGDLVHRGAAMMCGGDIRGPRTIAHELVAGVNGDWSDVDKLDNTLRAIEEQCRHDDPIGGGANGLWSVEAGYAYDLRTGEVRGPFKREPGETGRPWEVAGSADLVFRRDDGRLIVRDWKPDDGKTARVADPSTHHQLWFLALCARRVHGFGTGVIVELAFYSERGIWIEATELSHEDLVEFESNLLSLGPLLEAYQTTKPGWHCEGLYCPAHASMCHAARALAERTVDVVQPLPADLLRRVAQSPDEARKQYEALRILRKVEPLLEQHVKAYAHARGPIPLAHGIELVAKVSKGRDDVLDTPEALGAIASELQSLTKDGAIIMHGAFTRPSASKSLVLDAWSILVGKKKGSADARKFVAALREKGLIVEGAPSIRLEERCVGQRDEEKTET